MTVAQAGYADPIVKLKSIKLNDAGTCICGERNLVN